VIKMSEKKFSAAIFDLDGTLSDSVPCILHCSRLVHEAMGLDWDEAEQRSYIGLPLKDAVPLFCPPERMDEYLSRVKEMNTIWLPDLLQAFTGIPELLAELRAAGTAVGIATSRQYYGTEISCKSIGIWPYLQTIVAADQVKEHKPAAEPALKALAALGVAPAEAVFIGDTPVDVGCGKNAGLSTIAVSWGVGEKSQLKAANPDYICDTVAELRDLLLAN
jgi:pyrophosphatase PpaX